MSLAKPHVAVIGAGVLGLSVARSLVRLGAHVTIYERNHAGAGTSATTFAWINSNGKQPDSYHRLNVEGMREHVSLQQESRSEARWLSVSGTFEWAIQPQQQEWLAARVTALQQLQYPVQEISRAALAERIPELRVDRRSGPIWYFPTEALVDPSVLLARLWSECHAHGAQLHEGVDVVDIDDQDSGVTLSLSSGARQRFDRCVVATGRWTPELLSRLALTLAMTDATQPNKQACGFLAVTHPQMVQLRSNLITPEMNVRPDGGGRLLLQTLDLDARADPAAPASLDGYVAQEMLARLKRLFSSPGLSRIERLVVGQRSRPADGLPAVGYLTQRVYVMATHSGMTLGPLLGRLVAEEIVLQRRAPQLADFSPDRLLNRAASEFTPGPASHFPAAQ
jgi:D-hydroxyproline dehydrogenase subunit beta